MESKRPLASFNSFCIKKKKKSLFLIDIIVWLFFLYRQINKYFHMVSDFTTQPYITYCS